MGGDASYYANISEVLSTSLEGNHTLTLIRIFPSFINHKTPIAKSVVDHRFTETSTNNHGMVLLTFLSVER